MAFETHVKRKFPNPKLTKAQLVEQPITHTLYFQAFDGSSAKETKHVKGTKLVKRNEPANGDLKLYSLGLDLYTLLGRKLDFTETEGRAVMLECNKSLLTKAFNPSKFDFNTRL